MLFLEGCLRLVCLRLLILATGFSHVEGRKGFGGTSQEWGYVTVRPGAKMFWWLYYTTSKDVTDPHDKPLLIGLAGGPGAASTGFKNFGAIGPVDWDLELRNSTWVNDYNVLFIDNPVGAGFSYVEREANYAKDNAQIASDLLECMRGFYNEAPKWLPVPVYITTESYGGKMTVEFALLWHQEQKSGKIKSNLRGIMMISPWISPIDSVLSSGPFLLQTGMIDTKGFKRIEMWTNYTKRAIEEKDWSVASAAAGAVESVIGNLTSNGGVYNILSNTYWDGEALESDGVKYPSEGDVSTPVDIYMNTRVKTALDIEGNYTWLSTEVFAALGEDFMKPVTDKVERLLNETDIEVFVINAQLDMMVPTSGTVKWVENLKWTYSTAWQKAPRDPLVINNIIAGYVKQYKNLKMYWINRAGHGVVRDNPAATSIILQSLTANAKWIN